MERHTTLESSSDRDDATSSFPPTPVNPFCRPMSTGRSFLTIKSDSRTRDTYVWDLSKVAHHLLALDKVQKLDALIGIFYDLFNGENEKNKYGNIAKKNREKLLLHYFSYHVQITLHYFTLFLILQPRLIFKIWFSYYRRTLLPLL